MRGRDGLHERQPEGDAISLRSLQRLQDAPADNTSIDNVFGTEAPLKGLPSSRASSNTLDLGASSNVSSNDGRLPAGASANVDSNDERPSTDGQCCHLAADDSNSVHSAIADSLRQLEQTNPLIELQTPLPESPTSVPVSIVGSSPSSIPSKRSRLSQSSHITGDASSLAQLESMGARLAYEVPLPESTTTLTHPSLASHHSAGSEQAVSGAGRSDRTSQRSQNPHEPSRRRRRPEGRRRRSHSSRRANSAEAQSTSHDQPTYWDRVAPLAEYLSHLKTLNDDAGRYKDRGEITCIDYLEGYEDPTIRRRFSPEDPGFRDRLHRLATLSNDDNDVVTRFILVEDLSASVIEVLGSAFEIDPEFFAEHLNRAGFGDMDYDYPLPERWETRGLVKPYTSLKWYRPVRQNPTVTEWLRQPSTLLSRTVQQTKGHTEITPASITWLDAAYGAPGRPYDNRIEHRIQVATNIFRRSWTISTRPANRSLDVPVKHRWWRRDRNKDKTRTEVQSSIVVDAGELDWSSTAIPTAWEEKASCFFYRAEAVPISKPASSPVKGA